MEIFDLTGTCYLSLKKNPFLKNAHWTINDSDFILTDANGNDILTDKLNKIKEIQLALSNDFSLMTLSKFEEYLKDDFIVNFLDINLTKKTFNESEIKTTFKDYENTNIVHDVKIPENTECVCVDFKKLSTIQKLNLFKQIKENKNLKWVMLHVSPDFRDYLKWFEIDNSIMFKNHIVYLSFI